MAKHPIPIKLALRDGSVFEAFSASGRYRASGEITVNTSTTGHQEIMTDPANAGKIVLFTHPHVGNYGAAEKFNESESTAQAALVKRLSPFYSNWQAESSFGEFIEKRGSLCAEGFDTRQIARIIFEKGETGCVIAPAHLNCPADSAGIPAVKTSNVSVSDIKIFNRKVKNFKIGILDMGFTKSLLEQIVASGAGALVIPYDAPASEISKLKLNGLIISSGPEDEDALGKVAETAGMLRGSLPMLGIAAGCVALGISLGGKIRKLPAGHRGMNYPVRPPGSFKGAITVQNHRMVIDEKSRLKKTRVSGINLNDNTIEKIESPAYSITAIEYYPSIPGPGKTNLDLSEFLKKAREKNA